MTSKFNIESLRLKVTKLKERAEDQKQKGCSKELKENKSGYIEACDHVIMLIDSLLRED
jgi:hypothetical protein